MAVQGSAIEVRQTVITYTSLSHVNRVNGLLGNASVMILDEDVLLTRHGTSKSTKRLDWANRLESGLDVQKHIACTWQSCIFEGIVDSDQNMTFEVGDVRDINIRVNGCHMLLVSGEAAWPLASALHRLERSCRISNIKERDEYFAITLEMSEVHVLS